MKIEIREKADKVKYPLLMIHKELNYIVLFIKECIDLTDKYIIKEYEYLTFENSPIEVTLVVKNTTNVTT